MLALFALSWLLVGAAAWLLWPLAAFHWGLYLAALLGAGSLILLPYSLAVYLWAPGHPKRFGEP